jgi:hypothetical protein
MDARITETTKSLDGWCGCREDIMTRSVEIGGAVVIALVLAASPAGAQQTSVPPERVTVQELILVDGSRFYGTIESQDGAEVIFRTTAGVVVRTPPARIASIRAVSGRFVGEEFQREDPTNTRLLFGPTGKALQRGVVYLGVYEFMMPFVQVGITDRISIGGGTPLVVGFNESERPFWVTPKVQLLSRRGTHVAAGVFHAFNPEGDGFGIAYGVVTKDVGGGAVTGGAGMGYTSDGDRGPVVMAGAEAPMRRNMKFISENYGWRSGGVISAAIRFFGENLSADVGIGLFFEEDEGFLFGVPVVNFVYRF